MVAAQEHLKALEIARLVLDDARPDDIEDFLLAIDRVVELEHDADRADRAARAAITVAAPDFRTLQVANDVSRADRRRHRRARCARPSNSVTVSSPR